LEGIFEAKVCYFQKKVEKHWSPEANNGLEKIRNQFDKYRETIYRAKTSCGTSGNNALSISEMNLQNNDEITGVLPELASRLAARIPQS
jgi:hypothetical protein